MEAPFTNETHTGIGDPIEWTQEGVDAYKGFVRTWVEPGPVLGRVEWEWLPDGTRVRPEFRYLPDGRTVMVPEPLWVSISDDRHRRAIRLVGYIQDDGTPAWEGWFAFPYPDDMSIPGTPLDIREGLSPADLRRWEEKALEMAVLAVDGEVEPPSIHRSEKLNQLDRQVANEMLRALRRKRGRPGRPSVPWDWKVKAKQLRDGGMSTRRISATGQFLNEHTGRPYGHVQIGRWIKEVEAAEQEETSDE
jgi:hypothetical protein